MGGLSGGGGQRVCWPPPLSKSIGGPGPLALPPLFLRLRVEASPVTAYIKMPVHMVAADDVFGSD